MTSKVTFRTRQIDLNKPIPILIFDDVPTAEFSEYAAISRGMPLQSGMEKDEETEHHLQEALTALKQFKTDAIAIPVPEIIEKTTRYNSIYADGFSFPNQLIHNNSLYLNSDEAPEYDLDFDDELWLQSSGLNIPPQKFERLLEKLDQGCGHKVMTLEEAQSLLRVDLSLVIAVYDYWLDKRLLMGGQPLIIALKQDKRDAASSNDPYVAFRRRTEKMQTRKNRKNDEHSYEKMVRLKLHMEKLRELFRRVLEREQVKTQLVENRADIFATQCRLQDFNSWALQDAENAVRKTSPQTHQHLCAAKMKDEQQRDQDRNERIESRPDESCPSPDENNAYAFIRLPGCRYLKPSLDQGPSSSDWRRHRYHLVTCPNVEHSRRQRQILTAYFRRRVGRGGRVVFDRTEAPTDAVDRYLAACDAARTDLSCPSAYSDTSPSTDEEPAAKRHRKQHEKPDVTQRISFAFRAYRPTPLPGPSRYDRRQHFRQSLRTIPSQLHYQQHFLIAHNNCAAVLPTSVSSTNVSLANSHRTNHSQQQLPISEPLLRTPLLTPPPSQSSSHLNEPLSPAPLTPLSSVSPRSISAYHHHHHSPLTEIVPAAAIIQESQRKPYPSCRDGQTAATTWIIQSVDLSIQSPISQPVIPVTAPSPAAAATISQRPPCPLVRLLDPADQSQRRAANAGDTTTSASTPCPPPARRRRAAGEATTPAALHHDTISSQPPLAHILQTSALPNTSAPAGTYRHCRKVAPVRVPAKDELNGWTEEITTLTARTDSVA